MLKLLEPNETALIVIDAQEKLMAAMGQRDKTCANVEKLLHVARLYRLPVLITEQNPGALGRTVPELLRHLETEEPLSKVHFNCCEVPRFQERLAAQPLKRLVITGVEAHVCVFQTCVSLIEKGYVVHVPRDAVDSRTGENHRAGLDLMRQAGAVISSTEAVIFQLLKQAGTPEFKAMLPKIR